MHNASGIVGPVSEAEPALRARQLVAEAERILVLTGAGEGYANWIALRIEQQREFRLNIASRFRGEGDGQFATLQSGGLVLTYRFANVE